MVPNLDYWAPKRHPKQSKSTKKTCTQIPESAPRAPEVILVSLRLSGDPFGTLVGPLWDPFGTIVGPFGAIWGHSQTTKRQNSTPAQQNHNIIKQHNNTTTQLRGTLIRSTRNEKGGRRHRPSGLYNKYIYIYKYYITIHPPTWQ